MNLYDIVGNLWEWTQEAAYVEGVKYSTNHTFTTYILRGGSLYNGYTTHPAAFRLNSYALGTGTNNGFRIALYIA